MVKVLSARCSVLSFGIAVLRFVMFIMAVFSWGSCGHETADNTNHDFETQTTKVTPTRIGGTGLTIDLIEGYAIDSQIDSAFKVYYFKPVSPTANEDEAGIYFGSHPDTSAPSVDYNKRIFDGEFMGNTVKWTEYTTAKYTQREVFIDRGPNDKIHSWCYSHDPATLDKLFWMIKTIR